MTNDQMKLQILIDLSNLNDEVRSKINVLEALDSDLGSSGCGDLNDQLTTMLKSTNALNASVHRAHLVVPQNK